jgi:hypothetical protein
MTLLLPILPAKAGTQAKPCAGAISPAGGLPLETLAWAPAFAGVSGLMETDA